MTHAHCTPSHSLSGDCAEEGDIETSVRARMDGRVIAVSVCFVLRASEAAGKSTLNGIERRMHSATHFPQINFYYTPSAQRIT